MIPRNILPQVIEKLNLFSKVSSQSVQSWLKTLCEIYRTDKSIIWLYPYPWSCQLWFYFWPLRQNRLTDMWALISRITFRRCNQWEWYRHLHHCAGYVYKYFAAHVSNVLVVYNRSMNESGLVELRTFHHADSTQADTDVCVILYGTRRISQYTFHEAITGLHFELLRLKVVA